MVEVKRQFLTNIVDSIEWLNDREGLPEGSGLIELMIQARDYLKEKNEEDDSRENIKTIYLDDWFTNYMFEDEIKSRNLDLNRNFREDAIGNLGDWLPISFITNWEEIKSLLNEVGDKKLGDYFESQGEIDWQGGYDSDFGQYTFQLEYESDKKKDDE